MTLCYLCCAPIDGGWRKTTPICAACATVHLERPAQLVLPAPADDGGAPPRPANDTAAPAPATARPDAPRSFRTFLDAQAPIIEALHQAIGAALAAGLAPCHIFLAPAAHDRASGTTMVVRGTLVTLHAAPWAAPDEILVCEAGTPEQIDGLRGSATAP